MSKKHHMEETGFLQSCPTIVRSRSCAQSFTITRCAGIRDWVVVSDLHPFRRAHPSYVSKRRQSVVELVHSQYSQIFWSVTQTQLLPHSGLPTASISTIRYQRRTISCKWVHRLRWTIRGCCQQLMSSDLRRQDRARSSMPC